MAVHAFDESSRTLMGGARVGLANATWPLARLTVDPEYAHLRAPVIANLWIPRVFVEDVRVVRRVLSPGFHFATINGTYDRVTFWRFNPDEVLEVFRQFGWPVSAGHS